MLTKHFSLEEFTRNGHGLKNVPTQEQVDCITALCVNVLEPVREYFKLPVVITSGFRSPLVNKSVGGVPTSQHTKGEAADFHIPEVSNAIIYRYITQNLVFDQIIAEKLRRDDPAAGWLHVSYTLKRPNRMENLSFLGDKYVKGFKYTGE